MRPNIDICPMNGSEKKIMNEQRGSTYSRIGKVLKPEVAKRHIRLLIIIPGFFTTTIQKIEPKSIKNIKKANRLFLPSEFSHHHSTETVVSVCVSVWVRVRRE